MSTKSTAYTTALHAALVTALRAGLSWRDACEVSGLAWSTWIKWRNGSKASNDPRVQALVAEAKMAHGIATQSLVASIKVAAQKDWKAALGLLEFRASTARRNADASRAHWQARLAKRLALETTDASRPVITIAAEGAALLDLREDK